MVRFLSMLLCALCAANVVAQPPDTVWTRIWLSPRDAAPRGVSQTPDGGYIIGGHDPGAFILRLNAAGDTLWSRRYSGQISSIFGVTPAGDGGYVWSGYSPSELTKTDADGNILWQHEYSVGFSYHALQPAEDDGFLFAGVYPPPWLPSFHEIRMVMVDAAGDSLWGRTYHGAEGASVDTSITLLPAADGGFLLIGGTNFDPDVWDAAYGYVLRIDSSGDSLWAREYPFSNPFALGTLCEDGGYALTSYGSGEQWIVRINSAGDTLWTRMLAELPNGFWTTSIQATWDSGFILGGDIWVLDLFTFVKLDDIGTLEWTRSFDAFPWLDAAQVIQTADSGFFGVVQRGYEIGGGLLAVKLASDSVNGVEDPFIPHPSSLILTSFTNPYNPTTTI